MRVRCELSEDGKRIEVFYRWSAGIREELTKIPGATYYSRSNARNKHGVSYWTLPLEIESGTAMRTAFGDDLEIGPRLWEWGKNVRRQRSSLRSISSAMTANLRRLPEVCPKLYEAVHIGPKGRWMTEAERTKALAGDPSFQAADVKFGSIADSPLILNAPGTGKTPITIGAVFESGLDEGPQLVVAPKSALETTWQAELEAWQPHPVYVATGTKAQKQRTIDAFVNEVVWPGFSGWLVINPDQLRFREEYVPCDWHRGEDTRTARVKSQMKKCPDCKHDYLSEFPELREIPWHTVIIDEAHKMLRNPTSLTFKGLRKVTTIEGGKRFVLTGTPMGGKIMNLWPLLNWSNPKAFGSKHRFGATWTDQTTKIVNRSGKEVKVPGESLKHCPTHAGHDDDGGECPTCGYDGRPDCAACLAIEDAFADMLAPYVVRRTKEEVLPWLPPKMWQPLWCDFGSAAHRKQYMEFQDDAATVVDGEEITKKGVLDEYMRLRQFSGFRHEWDEKREKLVPTMDSGKLEQLQGKLEELGIWDGSSDRQAVIFSQFSEVVDLVEMWLNFHEVPVEKITGEINKKGQRADIQKRFQSGGATRVLVMTTTAGGVSINLDRASDVFILDETWDPDDQEQAEDRCHRASRIHQVTIYYLRTKHSIEEYVYAVTGTKSARNLRTLDLRRLLKCKPSLA